MVNLMCQLDQDMGAQIFGQTLLWVFLGGHLWMRLTFKKLSFD